MIIAVLLMILGFSVSVLFGMWCMYEEGIHEPKRMEETVKQVETSYARQENPLNTETTGEVIYNLKSETDKRRGHPDFRLSSCINREAH